MIIIELYAKKDGSFNKVMSAIALFNKYKVEYNILSVITGNVARHVSKVYSFFKGNNFRYLQFIPCLDPLDGQRGENDYSLSWERYVYFLKNIFDLWYEDVIKGNIISIRYFDNLVGLFMGYRPEACGMLGECQCQFVIEADGGVYPCDFYVTDKWLLGNIRDKGIEELGNSDRSMDFINASRYLNPECRECKWFSLCRGGCRRDREPSCLAPLVHLRVIIDLKYISFPYL